MKVDVIPLVKKNKTKQRSLTRLFGVDSDISVKVEALKAGAFEQIVQMRLRANCRLKHLGGLSKG